MKIKLTFKHPDLDLEVEAALIDEIKASWPDPNIRDPDDDLDPYEFENMQTRRDEILQEGLSKWLRHKELLTVEYDTETGTLTPIEVKLRTTW